MAATLPDRAVLPVIHPQDEEQTLRNIEVAIEAGAAGVFIVNNDIAAELAVRIFISARREFPEFWLGVNLLGCGLDEAFVLASSMEADALQTDNAKIGDLGKPSPAAVQVWDAKQKYKWSFTYFGGVAFKGQQQPLDLQRTLAKASGLMDVVTTSGDATGRPPSLGKVVTMREMLGSETRLAIASGISIDNIDSYLPYADYFLVGSSISPNWVDLDLQLTTELVARVRDHHPSE